MKLREREKFFTLWLEITRFIIYLFTYLIVSFQTVAAKSQLFRLGLSAQLVFALTSSDLFLLSYIE